MAPFDLVFTSSCRHLADLNVSSGILRLSFHLLECKRSQHREASPRQGSQCYECTVLHHGNQWMCLLAQDRTRVSWLGVCCSLMERFRSGSRCVYNYTLGNRILSVYKRRMFWQLLSFFENSLRKQLWVPSSLFPLQPWERWDPGTLSPGPQTPRLSDLAEAEVPGGPFSSTAVVDTPSAPGSA